MAPCFNGSYYNRLLIVTVITSFCADYRKFLPCHASIFDLSWPSFTTLVVASIEETADRYHIPKPFIGLILLPIVVSFLFVQFFNNANHLLKFDCSTGKRSRTCHVRVDGNEKQDGADDRDLRGQFNCTRSHFRYCKGSMD